MNQLIAKPIGAESLTSSLVTMQAQYEQLIDSPTLASSTTQIIRDLNAASYEPADQPATATEQPDVPLIPSAPPLVEA